LRRGKVDLKQLPAMLFCASFTDEKREGSRPSHRILEMKRKKAFCAVAMQAPKSGFLSGK
jgi:hypothetical protein